MHATSRVRQLDLLLRAPNQDQAEIAEIRRSVEQGFIPGVLEACDQTVHARLGLGALVFLRRLDLQWVLDHDDLGSAPLQRKLGHELAEAVLSQLQSLSRMHRLRPPPDAAVAVFESEGHLRAAHVSAALEGDTTAWYFAALADEPDVWTAACESGPTVLHEMLESLVAMGTARRALDRLDAPLLARLRQVLPAVSWPAALVPADGPDSWLPAPPGTGISEAAPTIASAAMPAAARPATPPTPPVDRTDSHTVRSTQGLQADRIRVPAADARQDRQRNAFQDPAGTASGEPAGPASPAESNKALTAQESAQQTDAAEAALQRPLAPPYFDTHHAGLFYIVGVILDIELAQHLYYAGILEGRFLGHVASLLIDDPDDAAPWLLGGALDGQAPPLDGVADWAAAEVAAKTRRSVAERLRARGLPCPLDDELAEQFDAIAAPLGALARSAGHDATTAGALAQAAAAIVHAFQARLRDPGPLAALRRRFAVDGQVRLEAQALCVTMPLQAIDLQLRLAGLDFDPGWVPWLARKLRLEFADGDGRAG